jgi:hypothetical protein
MTTLRGKSLVAISRDIADGYVIINPIFLKPLDADTLKELYQQIMKLQTEIRGEKFPFKDIEAIRYRNIRLQRLHGALMIIKNFARERGMRQLFL